DHCADRRRGLPEQGVRRARHGAATRPAGLCQGQFHGPESDHGHAGHRAQGRRAMRRVLWAALALAACAQQQETVRNVPAAGALEPDRDGGVVAPGAERHKPAAPTAGAAGRTPAGTERESRAPAPPKITTLPSGITLLELPSNQNAIVNVQLRFRTGSVDDPRGKAGLTYLTARVMAEGGTQALSAKQLLEALFPLAAELDVRVDKELTTFLARVHRDNLAKFLPIVTDVVLHPRWDPEEFRRLRDAAVNDIEKRLRQGD